LSPFATIILLKYKSYSKGGLRGILISIDNSELDVRNWKLPSRTPSLKGATRCEDLLCPPLPHSIF
jgi:hypothetical protein